MKRECIIISLTVLPTRFSLVHGTSTLIDNIYCNEIDKNTSGIFTNEISDHQMIFSYSNDPILDKKSNNYIEIESNSPEKLNHFLEELKSLDLTEKLNQNPFANPNKNYDIFIDLLTDTKKRILPKKKVKFN